MAQVIKVIRKLEVRILTTTGVRGTNLSPTAQARTHPVTLAIVGNMAL